MNNILNEIIKIHKSIRNISNLLNKLFNFNKIINSWIPEFPENYKLKTVRMEWSNEHINPSRIYFFDFIISDRRPLQVREYSFEYNLSGLLCEIEPIIIFLEKNMNYVKRKQISFELSDLEESIDDIKKFLENYLETKINENI